MLWKANSLQIVQVNVPDVIAKNMHSDLKLDGIGAPKYAELDQLNDLRLKSPGVNESR